MILPRRLIGLGLCLPSCFAFSGVLGVPRLDKRLAITTSKHGSQGVGPHPKPQLQESASSGEPLPLKKKASSLLDVMLLDSHDEKATIWKSRSILFKMIRPTSIPGIILFHFLGIYLVTPSIADWKKVVSQPASWLTLLVINLVSASSMIVNDYYDAKLGRDLNKEDTSNKYILLNKVSPSTVRVFLMQLYGLSLYVTALLPGILTRLSATTALIMTYLYTKHLKPRMVLKNVVCASLIAFAPVTSGLVARAILNDGVSMSFPNDLWRLTLALFSAVVSREIYMDCNDVNADRMGGIRTIPVVRGKPFAVKAAQFGNIVMAFAITAPPAYQFYNKVGTVRPLVLSGLASLWQLTRGFQIIRSRGEDQRFIRKTVDLSLFVVVLMLASFL